MQSVVLGSQLGLSGMVLGGKMGLPYLFMDSQMGMRFMESYFYLDLYERGQWRTLIFVDRWHHFNERKQRRIWYKKVVETNPR